MGVGWCNGWEGKVREAGVVVGEDGEGRGRGGCWEMVGRSYTL